MRRKLSVVSVVCVTCQKKNQFPLKLSVGCRAIDTHYLSPTMYIYIYGLFFFLFVVLLVVTSPTLEIGVNLCPSITYACCMLKSGTCTL